MKTKVKSLIILITFFIMFLLCFSVNVQALTIIETTEKDEYDTIENNSIVLGITKFEPNVVLTAGKASVATFNDSNYNKDNEDYTVPTIYYYLGGSWFEIDTENKAKVISDTTLIEDLTKQDIYFVNNIEKQLKIEYEQKLSEGETLEFKTDKPKKDNEIIYSNNLLTIPATINSIVANVNNSNGASRTVALIDKEAPNSTIFTIRKPEKIGADGEFKYIVLDSGKSQIVRYVGCKTDITIPAVYDGYTVFSVGNQYAGSLTAERYHIIGNENTIENTTVTNITISEGIEEIELGAFSGCSALTKVTFPKSLKRIGDYAFTRCGALTGTLEFPENIEYIGVSAFERCAKISGNLVIPSKVTEINNYAFNRCTNLKGSLVLHDNITRIGRTAFQYCGFTGTLDLPEELVEIDSYAFNQCKGLTGDLIIPNKVKIIGDWTFQHCSGFKGKLTLSNSLEIIGDGLMNHCSNMTNKTLVIPKTVIRIGSLEDDATHTLYNFATNSIEEYVVEEGNKYFKSINGIIYDIDVERLVAYPALKRQKIYEMPEGITKIDELAFSRAGSRWHQKDRENTLEKIILPNSLILDTNLPSNYLNVGSNLAVGLYKYTGVRDIVLKADNPNYKVVDNMLYSNDGKILWYVPVNRNSEIKILDGTTTIKDGALYTPWDRTVDQKITIPASVTEIGDYELGELNIFVSRGMLTIDENCIYKIEGNKVIKK